MTPKRTALLMLVGAGETLMDAGHVLADAGDWLAEWAIRALPSEPASHPAELSNDQVDAALG